MTVRSSDELRDPTGLDRDRFLRWMVRDIAGQLQRVLGEAEAYGWLSLVGGEMGRRIADLYRSERGPGPWSTATLGEVMVDLKDRIGGGFHVVEQRDDGLVLENTVCPFGDAVRDRPALCLMTSNVFGRLAADQWGEASVSLDETIAGGAGRCLVRVSRTPALDTDPDSRTYYADGTRLVDG